MLLLVLKRMLSNKWMVICLLIGSIIAVALISSIPLYTNGVLQRMLVRDLENFQTQNSVYPGTYKLNSDNLYIYKTSDRLSIFKYFNQMITEKMAPEYGLPILAERKEVSLAYSFLYPAGEISTNAKKKSTAVTALSDFENHITITKGEMYSKEAKDGVYEVVVTEKAMKDNELVLNKVYPVELWGDKENNVIKVKVTGLFTIKSNSDPYWSYGSAEYDKNILMDYDLFWKEFIQKNNGRLNAARWYYALDYHKINVENLGHITSSFDEQAKQVYKYSSVLSMKMPAIEIMKEYTNRAKQLKTTLWVIIVPVLLMLIFYIFMVSQLLVKNDENGIAVWESRGASRYQITMSYLLESLIISAGAVALGPPLGLFICTILGSSNGFLEFVQRTALPLKLNPTAYLYSLAAVVFLIATMLIPVIASSRVTIVNRKQGMALTGKRPIWSKLYLDIISLIVAGYGYYRYKQMMEAIATAGNKASEMKIDPLLFAISTLFVLGIGLLFLRIYPYLVRLVYWVGRKFWPPELYVSLLQVGRSKGQEQFLMLFIILAISIGMFNANSARTINRNVEEKVQYAVGADVNLMAKWEDNRPKTEIGMPGSAGMPGSSSSDSQPIKYVEPDFRNFSKLSGVELATKVFKQPDAVINASGESTGGVTVMGIVPNEFAKTAWFRADLLPHHWIEYVNLLADAPRAFILSSNLKKDLNIKEGETIYVSWGDQSYLEGTVYQFVDYWPTLKAPTSKNSGDITGFVVMNLSYIQNKLAIQPYQVWIKKQPGATDKQINDDIIKKKLDISTITYTNQELIKKKNDPLLQGTNGALTLGFVAAMIISLLGFLIYWIISIQSRVLQFGIFRAMGLSLSGVIAIIAFEQLLVSGAAILAGITIGSLAGDLFIPFFQMLYSAAEQVPPFKIVALREDYIKIYAVLGIMLLSGFTALWRLIAGIKIDQALKLGED